MYDYTYNTNKKMSTIIKVNNDNNYNNTRNNNNYNL